MATDNWRPVPGYEGFYEVSDLGDVRGLSRTDCAGRTRPRKAKRPYKNRRGYRSVDLYRDDKRRGFRIARLVLLAFVGPCPDGMEAAHNNGVHDDDRLNNLRWDTHVGNCADKRMHGTAKFYGRKKFSDDDIRRVREMHRSGVQQKLIASSVGMSRAHVCQVLSGELRATAL